MIRWMLCVVCLVGCGQNSPSIDAGLQDANDATVDVEDGSYVPSDAGEFQLNVEPCNTCCPGQCGVNWQLPGAVGTVGGNGHPLM
jgi:hypothetical protein